MKDNQKLYEQTKTFLLAYAAGKYGQNGSQIAITPQIVQQFLDKSNQRDLKEVMSYLEFMDGVIEGAADLEDWIQCVINKD